jgi:di/tricarboxylate transporter
MTNDTKPEKPEDGEGEIYYHEVKRPEGAVIAFIASFIFFGAGQLLKGHFKRFFVLWGILLGLVGLLAMSSLVSEPGSAVRVLSGVVVGIAMFLLYCYQLLDAIWRPR